MFKLDFALTKELYKNSFWIHRKYPYGEMSYGDIAFFSLLFQKVTEKSIKESVASHYSSDVVDEKNKKPEYALRSYLNNVTGEFSNKNVNGIPKLIVYQRMVAETKLEWAHVENLPMDIHKYLQRSGVTAPSFSETAANLGAIIFCPEEDKEIASARLAAVIENKKQFSNFDYKKFDLKNTRQLAF